MKSSFLRLVLPLAALAFVAPGSAFAQKGKGDTGGSTGPVVIPGGTYAETYVIDTTGSYVLGGNRTMTDPSKMIIDITAPDVTLDLGGFRVAYSAPAPQRVIHAFEPENIEVRNGTVANGAFGIWTGTGKGVRIIDVRSVSCGVGIFSRTPATLIDRCLVSDSTIHGINAHWAFSPTIKECAVNAASGIGISLGDSGTVVRSSTTGGEIGVYMSYRGTLLESTVSNASNVGTHAGGHSLVQNCHIFNNAVTAINAVGDSVDLNGNSVRQFGGTAIMITGKSAILSNNRIRGAVSGSYTNGGGNVLQ